MAFLITRETIKTQSRKQVNPRILNKLTICMLVIFVFIFFLSPHRMLIFVKNKVFKDSFKNNIRVYNSLTNHQTWYGSKMLHWLIAQRTSKSSVVFVFNVPPTAKVIWRRGHGLKSHPTDWWSRESNLRSLVYEASDLSTTPQRLLKSSVLLLK